MHARGQTTPGSGSLAMSVLWTTLPTELKDKVLSHAQPQHYKLCTDLTYDDGSYVLATWHAKEWEILFNLLCVDKCTQENTMRQFQRCAHLHITRKRGTIADESDGQASSLPSSPKSFPPLSCEERANEAPHTSLPFKSSCWVRLCANVVFEEEVSVNHVRFPFHVQGNQPDPFTVSLRFSTSLHLSRGSAQTIAPTFGWRLEHHSSPACFLELVGLRRYMEQAEMSVRYWLNQQQLAFCGVRMTLPKLWTQITEISNGVSG